MSTISVPAAAVTERPVPGANVAILDRLLGPSIFFLAIAFLILAAGLSHRVGHGGVTALETAVIFWGLLVLWPIFVLEGLLRLAACRRPDTTAGRRLAGFLGVCLFPALRLGGRAYADASKIWIPGLGWTRVDQHLRCRLERFISVPMLIIALMMLPLLALEYYWLETVRGSFGLSLLLDIGSSIIWLAFALEFIVMVSVADDRVRYCLRNWLDLAVVCLPLIDFLPVLRLLRLTGLLDLQQLGRLSRLYRLRGLVARTWRAVLLLDIIQRLFGRYREKRLQRLKMLLSARQDEIAELRQEIAELESLLAKAKAPSGCANRI